jgi:hypothetical protein
MTKFSSWYLNQSKALSEQGQVLGIHVRRGDYSNNPDIGMLASSYYELAIKTLLDRGSTWEAVWVFSDDLPAAKLEIGDLLSVFPKVHFVEAPSSSHSFESMALMSQTSGLVMANSTFSWWGAALGRDSRLVVCPDKWFAGMEDPTDLCPPEWIRVTATWI